MDYRVLDLDPSDKRVLYPLIDWRAINRQQYELGARATHGEDGEPLVVSTLRSVVDASWTVAVGVALAGLWAVAVVVLLGWFVVGMWTTGNHPGAVILAAAVAAGLVAAALRLRRFQQSAVLGLTRR